MINELPITPEAYLNFWKTLAEWHSEISHSDVTPRFVVINETHINPFTGTDLGQLINGARSTLNVRKIDQSGPGANKLLMVATEWVSDLELSRSRPKDMIDGSIILLGKVKNQDWDARNAMLDKTYNVGRELIAWLIQFCHVNSNIVEVGDTVTADPIGPITQDKLYGYRFDFELNIVRSLTYDPDNFQGNEPARIID